MPEDKSWLAESLERAQGGYTLDQLSAAFDSVKDPENWKYPIDATLPAGTNMDLVSRAVTWFAGCLPDWYELEDGRIRVTAPGYYNSVGS